MGYIHIQKCFWKDSISHLLNGMRVKWTCKYSPKYLETKNPLEEKLKKLFVSMLVGNKCMHNKKSWLTTGSVAIVERIGHLPPRFYPHKWSLNQHLKWSLSRTTCKPWSPPRVHPTPPKYSLDIIKTTTFTQKRHYKENKRIDHLQGENVCKFHMWPSLGATPSYMLMVGTKNDS